MDITVSEDIDSEFLEVVRDILEDREFKKLNSFRQHLKTTRFMHSLNVSYISWCLARRFRCDARAAARAGLLHDFFLYDFRDKQPTRELQAFYHPKVAAYNSTNHFNISEKEANAILSHMFPLGPLPTSKEAWLITCADKICATMELFQLHIALAKPGRVKISAA